MKNTMLWALAATTLGTAMGAQAQEQGRVLSRQPIVQQVAIPRQVCGTETVYGGTQNSGAGAVLGAIAGGALGNTIGGGTGRVAATALGVVGGALVGNRVEGAGQPQYQNVQRCQNDTYYENRTVGYDVVYEYGGRRYRTQTSYDPGSWIALDVQPSPNYASSYGNSYSTYRNPYQAQPAVVQTYSYPAQPQYVTPPTTIEYNYNDYQRQHGNPYWR